MLYTKPNNTGHLVPDAGRGTLDAYARQNLNAERWIVSTAPGPGHWTQDITIDRTLIIYYGRLGMNARQDAG